jgi:UDP-GlcNAc:undecaprenyl-phosphate GlcNAc-1-phosphate transferase
MSEELLKLLKYPAVFLAAGLLCQGFLIMLARVATPLRLIDAPRDRHIHSTVTPAIGGLAIFAAFSIVGFWISASSWAALPGRLDEFWFALFFLIGGLFVLLGAMDDRHHLPARWKLAGQIIIASLAYALHIRFSSFLGVPLPIGLDWVLTVCWFLAFVNAFNLIDGMDGVATGIAITGLLGLMIFFGLDRQPISVLMLLSLLGACAVFLHHNFHPARFFLGDSGSMLLGAFFACASLAANTKSMTVATLGFPLLVAGVPLMDSLLAIWRRLLRRVLVRLGVDAAEGSSAEVMSGDLEHLHHRLARRGYSQRRVAVTLYSINGILVLAGLVMVANQSLTVGVAMLCFVLLVYLVVGQLASVEMQLSGEAVIRGLHRPDPRLRGVILYPVFDLIALLLGSLLTVMLVRSIFYVDMPLRSLWLELAPFMVAGPLLSLFVFGVYRRIWSRARVTEYAFLFLALVAGVISGVALLVIIRDWTLFQATIVASQLLSFCSMLLIGGRATPRLIMDLMAWKRRHAVENDQEEVVLYGASLRSTLLLRELSFRHPDHPEAPMHVLGYIDDNKVLWSRTIHGLRVLGGRDQLIQLVEQGKVNRIIVTCDLDVATQEAVMAAVAGSGVALEQWHFSTKPLMQSAKVQAAGDIPASGASTGWALDDPTLQINPVIAE